MYSISANQRPLMPLSTTRRQPDETSVLTICWGDARMSNAIFATPARSSGRWTGRGVRVPGPSRHRVWLATREQMLKVNRIVADPELPGFDSRAVVVGKFEEMIGHELENLDWYEIFAMVRMGCCILRTQVLVRNNSQGDHFPTRAPILPAWTVDAIRA